MRSSLLDRLETLLGEGLGADARSAGHTEGVARVLLSLPSGKGLPMAEMARRLGRDPSTATRFVDAAARGGFVAREPGADRRRRLVFLTRAGEDARARLLALRDARAKALPDAVQARTGLGAGEVEWFVEAVVEALAESSRLGPPPAPTPAGGSRPSWSGSR
jgi:DNA-binding MarR family transcriptional regulator